MPPLCGCTTQITRGAPLGEVLLPVCCGVTLRACKPLFRAVTRFMHEYGDEPAREEQASVPEDEPEPAN
jgi:hypothetical protein